MLCNSINLNQNDVACFNVPGSAAKKVKRITLERNRLVNATFAGMSHLALLSLADNELETVPPLDGCKKLAELNLSKNRIASMFCDCCCRRLLRVCVTRRCARSLL